MEEFIRRMNEELDAFLRGSEQAYADAADELLDAMTYRDLEQADLTFWYIAILDLLESQLRVLEQFVRNRAARIANEVGANVDARSVAADAVAGARAAAGYAAAGLNATTLQALLTGLRGEDLAASVVDKVREALTEMAKNLDTVISVADRQAVWDAGVKEGFEFWIYAGPADQRNRVFCRDVVRRKSAFTESGIEKLNAHPDLHKYVPPNVRTMCGGYNCRHVWWPVDKGYVDRNGLKVET